MIASETTVPLSIEKIVWTDPERLSGVPCFTGTRVPVQTLFDYLKGGDTIDVFLDSFPGVTQEQISGALYFGKQRLIGEQEN